MVADATPPVAGAGPAIEDAAPAAAGKRRGKPFVKRVDMAGEPASALASALGSEPETGSAKADTPIEPIEAGTPVEASEPSEPLVSGLAQPSPELGSSEPEAIADSEALPVDAAPKVANVSASGGKMPQPKAARGRSVNAGRKAAAKVAPKATAKVAPKATFKKAVSKSSGAKLQAHQPVSSKFAPAPSPVQPSAPVNAGAAGAAPTGGAPAKEGAAAMIAPATTTTFAGFFNHFMLEDKTMDMNANFAGFQEAITEAQSKAKAAFDKSTSVLGEVGEFTKGNVEAVIESGKILAEGVQGMGTELVAEGRSAFETFSADIKELAAVKSPTDFFKIQGDLMRKNFDSAVAYGSKNSEAMLKLFSDAVAPISGRVNLAMEKARSTSF